MRRPALVVLFALLVLTAGCGKKPDPAPAPEPNLGGVALAPAPAPVPVEPPKKKWPPKPVDPNNFAGKSLAQWRAELRAKDSGRVHLALRVIQALGPQAAEAVPDVLAIEVPGFNDYDIYSKTFPVAVRSIGKAAVPHIVAALTNEKAEARVRNRALDAASALGPDAIDALPHIEALAKGTDTGLRGRAIYALADLGPAAHRAKPIALTALKLPDENERLTAALTLARMDPDGTIDAVLPVLLAVVEQPKPDHLSKNRAHYIVTQFGTRGASGLTARLKKPDGKLNQELLNWLYTFEPKHLAPSVPELVKLMEADPARRVPSLAPAIGLAGAEGKAALPAVLKLAAEPAYRSKLVVAAHRLGAKPEELLPLVREAVAKPPVGRSELALVGLLGPTGKEFVPMLTTLLTDPQREIRWAAATALATVEPTSTEACRVLLEETRAKDSFTNVAAQMKGLPAGVAAGFKPHLKHPDPALRLIAALHIVPRDPTNAEAVQLLKENASVDIELSGKPPLQYGNSDVIGAFRAAGAGGVPHLVALFKHPVRGTRAQAALALAELGSTAVSAAADVAAAVENADDNTKFALLVALRRMGPAAKAHADVAVKALTSPTVSVRFAAADALLAFDPTDARAIAALPALVKPVFPGPDEQITTIDLFADEEHRRGRERDGRTRLIHELAWELLFEADPEAAVRAIGDAAPRHPPGPGGPNG